VTLFNRFYFKVSRVSIYIYLFEYLFYAHLIDFKALIGYNI